LTVGHGRHASVTLDDANAPELWSLVRVGADRADLVFTESMDLDLATDDGLKTSKDLIEGGGASPVSEQAGLSGWQLSLMVGGKVVVRFGDVACLIKARASRAVPDVAPSMDTPGLCGGCAAALPPPLDVVGSLRPCDRCGAVNGPPDPEDFEDSIQTSTEDADEQETELGLGPVATSLSEEPSVVEPLTAGTAEDEEAGASAPVRRRKRRGREPWTRVQLALLFFGLVSGATGAGLILFAVFAH